MDMVFSVLIADDSAFARKVIRSFLEGTEFNIVAAAENGQIALEEFSKHTPDIALLDVIMPDMSGAEVLKAIIGMRPNAKVVMCSSLGTESMVTECLSIGAKGFIQKPVDKDALLNVLRKIVTE